MTLDKKFIDQFVNVTVKAASAASHLVGRKDKNAADQAAVDSMRAELNKIDMVGEVVTIDVQDYHTPILEVVEAANKANVGHLIFYHHLPAPRTSLMENIMYRGVDQIRDGWTASHDGTMLVLPLNSDEIEISSVN